MAMGNIRKGRGTGYPIRAKSQNHDIMSLLRKALAKRGLHIRESEIDEFEDWLVEDLLTNYQKHRMNKRIIALNELNGIDIHLPNGTKGKPYASPPFTIPGIHTAHYSFDGLEELGLKWQPCPNAPIHTYQIVGSPKVDGEFDINLSCKYDGWHEGDEPLVRPLHIVINPDPRSLWRNIETPKDIPYYKPDTANEYVMVDSPTGEPRKDMVAASVRGRSHAQDGKPRDDHFQLYHCDKTDWYIMAVADGAGSARYSRKGSEVACRTVVDFCREQLTDDDTFERHIREYVAAGNMESAQKKLGPEIYNIICKAALMAHRQINEVAAQNDNAKPKDYATTLMVAVCKRFDFGWFFATFWVGDGAVCLYNANDHTASLLGVPDEGEFSGQTRFLTMPDIFSDPGALYKRLRFGIREDFTALILMTDGVSDPMFGTDANLNSVERWDEFWATLRNGFPEDHIPGVDLSDNNEAAKDQLERWLGFWRPGEHDDRTIAILY